MIKWISMESDRRPFTGSHLPVLCADGALRLATYHCSTWMLERWEEECDDKVLRLLEGERRVIYFLSCLPPLPVGYKPADLTGEKIDRPGGLTDDQQELLRRIVERDLRKLKGKS